MSRLTIVTERERQLLARLRKLEGAISECETCGGRPCVNPSFCRACRIADAKLRRQRQQQWLNERAK